MLCQKALRQFHCLGRDYFPLEILHRTDRGILRYGNHPTRRVLAHLGKSHLRQHVHVGIVVRNPILPRQAAIEESMLDVPGDFLRAQQANRQFRIIDRRPSSLSVQSLPA